ncbi:hypothetical protein FF098_010780 [Parvularcula flava]|uniref:Uncharacterized protein n=1 Tax=Aquisalinus luteolus TaxID=1566827 RepID=A0A8J3ERE0_9PROT|nr:hypothetical protein [Aquisalinus luteolus]NHK28390.1 hypothetical protein [Aquisalinus luteolus]GGH98331.1 hypothetical protein GCM10011355_21670 [Aquisalinus luteolus]
MNIMGVKGALVMGGLIIGISAGLAGLEALGIVGGAVAERAMGAVLGVVLILYGNIIPKLITPLAGLCDAGRKQALQRFAGWTFVLGGIGYALAWLVVPIDYAAYAAVACGVVAIGIVIARCLMLRTIV